MRLQSSACAMLVSIIKINNISIGISIGNVRVKTMKNSLSSVKYSTNFTSNEPERDSEDESQFIDVEKYTDSEANHSILD